MLDVPAAPEFVPYMTAISGASFIAFFAVVWFILRSRRQDKMYHEFRIVTMFIAALITLACWAMDWSFHETQHGLDIRTAREIERVYDIEFDRVSAEALLEGGSADAADGKTYRLEDGKLMIAEGWVDVR